MRSELCNDSVESVKVIVPTRPFDLHQRVELDAYIFNGFLITTDVCRVQELPQFKCNLGKIPLSLVRSALKLCCSWLWNFAFPILDVQRQRLHQEQA